MGTHGSPERNRVRKNLRVLTLAKHVCNITTQLL